VHIAGAGVLASQYSAHHRQTAGDVALIADDDPNVLDVLRPILTEANYNVVIASGGRQALEIAPHVDASAAIFDLSVPDGDGLETYAALRRLPNWRDVPMLILTSSQTDKALRAAVNSGKRDFICKPFVPSELLRRIARAIGEEPVARGSERMALPRDAPPGEATGTKAIGIKARRPRKLGAADDADRFERQQRFRETNGNVARQEPKAAPRPDADDEPPSQRRILVADDDELTRHVVIHILGHEGYLAHGVTDGREAVAAVIRDNYDLVLMDVRMPALGGSEATRMIHQLYGVHA
jgi:CheY-like chemotaxis protein